MAISKQQYDEQQEIIESFKKFSDLYRSKVELSGEKLRKINNFKLPLDPSEPITYTETNEISIKMPQDEFERFLQNWKQYLDVMHVAHYNPLIREELHKIHMLAQLLK